MTTGKNEGDAPLFFCGWLGIEEEGVLAGFEGRNIVQYKFANMYVALTFYTQQAMQERIQQCTLYNLNCFFTVQNWLIFF